MRTHPGYIEKDIMANLAEKTKFCVGILGGGQLARMLTLAAAPLNIRTLCIDPVENACANQVTHVIQAHFDDEQALQQFAEKVDVITFETENIPLKTIDFLSQTKPIYPNRLAIATAQDRLLEKTLCQQLGIATPKFHPISNKQELEHALNDIGTPAIIKTRRFGYDGKGQVVIKHVKEVSQAWSQFDSQDLIVEQMIPFDYEVSIIAVRNPQGHQQFYPLIRNYHEQGILRYSIAPWQNDVLFDQAKSIMQKLLDHFSYVGVMTLECFVLNNQLIANEIAPRVHNSGHWSIEGAYTSQFENHIRAISGLPLGCCDALGYHVMFNHIGEHANCEKVLMILGSHYHDYGKAPRPNRKIGHVTVSAENNVVLHERVKALEECYPEYKVKVSDVI